MLSFRSYLMGVLLLWLAGCKAPASIFSFKQHVKADFFREFPHGETEGECPIDSVTGMTVYYAGLVERLVEKEDVLEFSMLNDSSKVPYAAYQKPIGYKQELYLLRLHTTEGMSNACLYLPVKFAPSTKKPGGRECIGFGPCYYGCIDTKEKRIQVLAEVKVKQRGTSFYATYKQPISMLLFLNEIPDDSTKELDVTKIVLQSTNKFGGSKPVVFNVGKVFHDPLALHFVLKNTIHF